MNYFEFCDVMKLMKPETTEEKLVACIEQLNEHLVRTAKLIENQNEIIVHQNERISMLSDIVYKLAPDIEIIETMAESPAEEADMIARYMNHGRYTE